MSDYYVGMKHGTFLAHNKHNILNSDLIFDCEDGNASEYQWNDGRAVLILWGSRLNQLRIIYIEEQKRANRT